MEWDWQEGKLLLWLTDEEAKFLNAALHQWEKSAHGMPSEMVRIINILDEALE